MAFHFPDVVEVRRPSRRYNCHGHAVALSHGWFNDPDRFIEDNYFPVSFDSPQVHDVVLYFNDDVLMHSAVVRRVVGGEITELRSKWGEGPETLHELRGVPPEYGGPLQLLRRSPGNAPFENLMSEADMPDPELEVPDPDTVEARVLHALENFVNPDIHKRLMLASSPQAARKIIESLPGMKDLIEIGPEAGRYILDFFQKEETQENENLSSVALYLFQRIPMEEAVQPLAKSLASGKFTGINSSLAAQAFLTSAGIDAGDEDPVSAATREAEKFK
jgi:hypothetical protein